MSDNDDDNFMDGDEDEYDLVSIVVSHVPLLSDVDFAGVL